MTLPREWRRLHKEELYDLNSSPNIIRVNVIKRKNGWGIACKGKRIGTHRILVGKPEVTIQLGRP